MCGCAGWGMGWCVCEVDQKSRERKGGGEGGGKSGSTGEGRSGLDSFSFKIFPLRFFL